MGGVHTKQLKPICGAFQTILSKDERMMDLAKKSFNSYLAFYYFHGNDAYMDPNALNKDDLAKMFGLMHTPKYKRFLKKCKAHKLINMPNELKMLLLDNKKKKQQKSDFIQLMAAENKKDCDDAPKWFKEAFKDKKEDKKEDIDVDIDNWLESESEQNDDN